MRWSLLAPVLIGLSAAAAAPPSAPRKVLPFIEDDYPKALAEARTKKLPLFIEAWAPW